MIKVIPEHNILATDHWFTKMTDHMWCFGNFDITNNIYWTTDDQIVLCEKDTINNIIWFNEKIWYRFNMKYNYDYQKTQKRLNQLVGNFGWNGYKCYCNYTDLEDRWENIRIPNLKYI